MRLLVTLLATCAYVTSAAEGVTPNKWCDGSKGSPGGSSKDFLGNCLEYDTETKKLKFKNDMPGCLGTGLPSFEVFQILKKRLLAILNE